MLNNNAQGQEGSHEKLRETSLKARQALITWGLFFAATVMINLLIPLAFSIDLYTWTYSDAKGLLLFTVNYAGFFLIVPLGFTKGWSFLKKPSVLLPIIAAALSVILWYPLHYIATVAIIVYIYLHLRFDLSELGFRSKGWKGDLVAIAIVGSLGIIQPLVSSTPLQDVTLGLGATIFRMFGNPASTVENMFYYGFVTNRIGNRYNRYVVPFLIGAMYTAHEISNPEYWYEGSPFGFIFFGVTIFAAIFLWRRNIVVIWLSDGLQWFLSRWL